MMKPHFSLLARLLISGLFLLHVGLLSAHAQVDYDPTPPPASATFSCATVTDIPVAECEALVALYTNTDGANWITNTDWLQTSTPCNWSGVACRAGQVFALTHYDNRLTGSIPLELGHLTGMKYLFLDKNQLSGAIPPELGNLSSVLEITLADNQLSGTVPAELGQLSNLRQLSLHKNQLSGAIPPTLGSLTNLLRLNVANNHLSGDIPPELGNLANLQSLSLNNNLLNGTISPALGNLVSLQTLWLRDNPLTGTLPPELGNLTTLQTLYIDNSLLSGPLPTSMTALSLTSFGFSNTDICEPGDEAFQTWLSGITYLISTEMICGTQIVSGTVWDDLDRDGAQDADEPPMSTLMVTMTKDSGSLDSVEAGRQTITDSNGAYRFANVAPGAYHIAVSAPSGYLPTVPGPVSITVPDGTDVTVPPTGLALASAQLYLPLIRR